MPHQLWLTRRCGLSSRWENQRGQQHVLLLPQLLNMSAPSEITQVGDSYHFDLFHVENALCRSALFIHTDGIQFVQDTSTEDPAMDYFVTVDEDLHVNGILAELNLVDVWSVGPVYDMTILRGTLSAFLSKTLHSADFTAFSSVWLCHSRKWSPPFWIKIRHNSQSECSGSALCDLQLHKPPRNCHSIRGVQHDGQCHGWPQCFRHRVLHYLHQRSSVHASHTPRLWSGWPLRGFHESGGLKLLPRSNRNYCRSGEPACVSESILVIAWFSEKIIYQMRFIILFSDSSEWREWQLSDTSGQCHRVFIWASSCPGAESNHLLECYGCWLRGQCRVSVCSINASSCVSIFHPSVVISISNFHLIQPWKNTIYRILCFNSLDTHRSMQNIPCD